MKGFTLIELLAVFSIIAILTALSIAGYSSFNNAQIFETSVSDVATLLNTARSRALSQLKTCSGNALTGYQVKITPGGSNYELDVVCGVTPKVVQQKSLPPNIIFEAGSSPVILFSVSSGTPVPTGSITLTGFGRIKTIKIDPTGVLSIH